MNLKDIGKAFLFVLATNFVGFLSGFFASGTRSFYQELTLPFFAPPAEVFPVVWTILYTLLGLSAYFALENDVSSLGRDLFFVQLLLNGLYSIIFFSFKMVGVALFEVFLLNLVVLVMFIEFYEAEEKAGYLVIPYILWILFAFLLNLSIFILN